MKKLGLLLFAGLFMLSCNQKPNHEKPMNHDGMEMHHEGMEMNHDGVKDGIFIHITESYNDPHKVLMPLKMAVMMSKDKDVLVYADIHSVELFVKGAKDLTYADFDSFQTYIKQLVDNNVGVYVCPTCLKIAGFKPEDLMDGVQIAQKDRFFDFTKGRIITLDY